MGADCACLVVEKMDLIFFFSPFFLFCHDGRRWSSMALQRVISSNLSECIGALWTLLVGVAVVLGDQDVEVVL